MILKTEQKAPLEPQQKREEQERSILAAMSQRDFCAYLNENASNAAARAQRRGLSAEDYLKTIALERKGEIWERELERPNKARWLRVEE